MNIISHANMSAKARSLSSSTHRAMTACISRPSNGLKLHVLCLRPRCNSTVGVKTEPGNCCQRAAAVRKRAHIDTRTAMKLHGIKSLSARHAPHNLIIWPLAMVAGRYHQCKSVVLRHQPGSAVARPKMKANKKHLGAKHIGPKHVGPNTMTSKLWFPATRSCLCADSQKQVDAMIAAGYACACTVRLSKLLQHWVLLPAAAMCALDFDVIGHVLQPRCTGDSKAVGEVG